MLYNRYDDETLSRVLLPKDQYHPYPTGEDRATWAMLPGELTASRIAEGERYLNYAWPVLPATLLMEFRREGNRRRYETVHFERRHALTSLVVAECLEGTGRFLDDIVNGIWQICEESFWGIPAHNTQTRFADAALPDTSDRYIDLFASETAALLAGTHYLLQTALDSVSVLIGERIVREVRERILDPYLARDDFWWLGLDPAAPDQVVNNWNPWCNGNCLYATLLLEPDDSRRRAVVSKVMRSLERFFDAYHGDGGCDEGPSYWGRAGGSLFDCLELLHGATNGAIDVYSNPLVQNIGRYLYQVHISGDYFVNFADGGARVSIPANLVYRYGKRIADEKLMALGLSAYQLQKKDPDSGPVTDPLMRVLPLLFGLAEMETGSAAPPLVRDAWLDGIQVMTAREREGSDRGFYLSAKGGHNGESHNHNDIGQFIVYRNGLPVLIDVGVETYSAKTFNAHRYEIWTMQSAYHNLPTIGGIQQQPGESFHARDVVYTADDAAVQLSLDIAPAYPAEAGVPSWRRTLRLDRAVREGTGSVTVHDTFALGQPADVTLSLMTPCMPALSQPNVLRLTDVAGDATDITYSGATFTGTIERITITDERLLRSWGPTLYRVLLRTEGPVQHGDWALTITAATRA
ncbi:MAG: heparinase II/III family protein [Armatimonadota bacterium]